LDTPSVKAQVHGGILGAVVGDALGLPFEGATREWLAGEQVNGMTGDGPHGRPAGTWSDDSSLLLCVASSLCSGYRPDHIASNFLSWWREGLWTPSGMPFGYGSTIAAAIQRMLAGVPALEAGLDGEGANGNGSLMRTLPVALYFSKQRRRMLNAAHEVSALTHAHPRSQMCCGIYCLVASYLLEGAQKREAVEAAVRYAGAHYRGEPWEAERPHLEAILTLGLVDLDRYQVRSGGYVVETLEAALWSLLRGRSYRNTLLIAVNLGGDTDTVGCVTGGLAGTHYGTDNLPAEWVEKLARLDDIEHLCERFYRALSARR
jgi:ADP-ribosylglycohydrolase